MKNSMQLSRIWHASEGRKFPLELTETGQFRLEVKEVDLGSLAEVKPDKDIFHVFLIQGENGGLGKLTKLFRSTRHLDEYPRLVILPAEDYRQAQVELALVSRTYLLEDSIRPQNLKILLELVLQQEYYRHLVYQLSRESRQQNAVFDNLLTLARSELKQTSEESSAYKSLLEFESSHHRFSENLRVAMEETMNLKNMEMLSMKSQLEAIERLSDYRTQEIADVRKSFHAAEAVLDLSRKENLERDKIINAMDRLRLYTDKELLDLYHENLELRKRLGYPIRE